TNTAGSTCSGCRGSRGKSRRGELGDLLSGTRSRFKELAQEVYALRSCLRREAIGGLREVSPDRVPDDGVLGGKPTDPGGEAVVFQPDERPDGAADGVPLAPLGPDLAALDAGERLQ